MVRCDPKGKDCIEGNAAKTFNCSTTCVGIYADVQWVGKTIEEDFDDGDPEAKVTDTEVDKVQKRLAELERKMEKVFEEGAIGQKGEEMDKEKYKSLVAEYRQLKSKNVKHFRFSSVRTSSAFGEFVLLF